MRSETAIANTKCPVLGNALARLLRAKACFQCSMPAMLAVLRWQSQAVVDLCYVWIVFKTEKHFEAVLINLLKHNLQCTFPKESRSPNKSWTFCDASQILHRTSPWICLFRSVGVLLLSFLGEEKNFSAVIQQRQLGVYKKNETTVGEATSLCDSPGATGELRTDRVLRHCWSLWSLIPAKATGECTHFQEKPTLSRFSKNIEEGCSAGHKSSCKDFMSVTNIAMLAAVKLPCWKLWNEVKRSLHHETPDPSPSTRLCFHAGSFSWHLAALHALGGGSVPSRAGTRRQSWRWGHSALT